MRVLLSGAGGFIGSHLVVALRAAGHEVLACGRDTAALKRRWPKLRVIATDYTRDRTLEAWLPRLKDIDLVINAVGIIREQGSQTFEALHTAAPIALFQACAMTGVRRVIQLSALGAEKDAPSGYHRSKAKADAFLRTLALDWAILQPSIVYGPGAKSMGLFQALASLPLIPLVGRGEQTIQPLHIDDLCRAVVDLMATPEPIRADIPLVGPKPLTLRALLTQLRHWLGFARVRFLSIPYPIMRAVAGVMQHVSTAPITPETLAMLQAGNTAPVAPCVARFGFTPKSLGQVLAAVPAREAERWHAGLTWLHPLLRISLALVWLLAGLVSAFVFPVDESFALLAQVGIPERLQPLMLYGAAGLDGLLGLALLTGFHTVRVGQVSLAVMLGYTLIITAFLPAQWAHPFGPVSKNLVLIVATLILLVLERK